MKIKCKYNLSPAAIATVKRLVEVEDPDLPEQVRIAPARHFGLDDPAEIDGATGTRAFKP